MAVEQEHPSIPLLSRLDHLDFMMKYMEGKGASMAEGQGRENGGKREKESKLIPLELAFQQSLFKGSLLDRVASLENRLFQLCLDMDYGRVPLPSSSSSSSQSTTQTTGSSSSTYTSMAGKPSSSSSNSSSYPVFNLTHHGHQQSLPHPHAEIDDKEKSDAGPRNQKKATTKKKKTIKMSDKSLKKLIPWPHLKILGC